MLNKIATKEIIDRYSETIKYSALLHDIGKLTINFQKFLNRKSQKPNLKFRHNEIGWAFLSKYLSDDFENKSIIINSVHWHHGISNKIEGHTDTEILDSLDEKSINNMLEYLIDCVGEHNLNENMEYSDSIFSPLFNIGDNLPILTLCRSILITSDRIASGLNDLSEVSDMLINNYFTMQTPLIIDKCKYDNTPRYIEQQEIVKECKQTTIVKAPAGFGKTMIGLLWGLRNGKKLIWVTPRNLVAESVYDSILNELSSLFINPSIQLVLGSEIEKTNSKSNKLFDADIIVTNIDNFSAPTFKNDVMDSSSLVFGCNVVFDEYHELDTKSGLMSVFTNIMKVRNTYTTSETLLLSATPINCEYLWETMSKKTTVLPNHESHYKAIHNKKYLINVLTERPKIKENTNTIVIKNTVRTAQEEKENGNYSMLLHNEYLKEKKEKDFNNLIINYGKNSSNLNTKPNIIGTHILQASLDISFNNLYEDVLSPQSTLQRIGRCDRFGNCIGECVINIIKESPKGDINKAYIMSQATIKNILYNRNLSDAWFEYLLPYDNKYLTLDELYVIYNSFYIKYETENRKHINANHDVSKKMLKQIYPIKFSDKNKSDILTAGQNKLRSSNSEIFYIVRNTNDEWVGPFTKEIIRNFDEEFNEKGDIINNMFKTMKKIRDSNSDFEFNDIIDNKKYITLDKIRKLSKKSNTPYIVYDRYYDDVLGIVKIKQNKLDKY